MTDGAHIDFDFSDVEAHLDNLGRRISMAVRPSAFGAASEYYKEVRRRVPIGKTGNLYESIYRAFSPESSRTGALATYHVSWNHTKAPHGHLVEFGHIGPTGKWVPAHSFLRSSFDALQNKPVEAAWEIMKHRIEEEQE